jgi:hypothetical protein
MRPGIIVFAAAAMAMPLLGLSATGAAAQEYCGFLPHLGAVVQCGYSNRQSCEYTIGKGAMCFVNPYLVLDERRATPFARRSEG